jgi:putative membrane protein (TIGR04086 family)
MTQNKRSTAPVPVRSTALTRRNKEQEDSPILISALKGALWGLFATVACGLLLITVTTAVAYANPDPAQLISPMGLIALLPSAFAGGFTASKVTKSAPMLCGILAGGVTTLAAMLLSLILTDLPSSSYAFWQSAALHAAAILFTILGSFAGNIKKQPKTAKRRFGH